VRAANLRGAMRLARQVVVGFGAQEFAGAKQVELLQVRHWSGCGSLVVGCWLLAAGCWLLVAGCWLLAAGCWLLVVGCWLLAARCCWFESQMEQEQGLET